MLSLSFHKPAQPPGNIQYGHTNVQFTGTHPTPTVGIERQVQEAQRDGEEEVEMGVSVHLR